MTPKRRVCYQILALVLALALIVPMLTACGDDDEDKTVTPSATTPAATTPAKTTPAATTPAPTVSKEPVKIGVLIDYSGPAAQSGWLADCAITFAEWYWNEKQGGIKVGDVRRPIEFDKYDTKNEVANTSAGARKLLLDKVVAITMGGISNQFAFPIADLTDPAKVLFSTFLVDKALFTDYKYVVSSFFNQQSRNQLTAELVVKKLQAKTVGIFAFDYAVQRENMGRAKEAILALDPTVKFTYEQYVQPDVKDYSPHLTRMKYEKPDVIIADTTQDAWASIANQIMGLGGLGEIKLVSMSEAGYFKGIEKSPGADGWYISLMFLPSSGIGTPAQLEFSNLWAEKCAADPAWCKKYSPTGAVPLPNTPVMYNPILTVIKAIELAGTTDQAKVAEAARSGKLAFDSPLGHLKLGTDGKSNLAGFYIQMRDGKAVPAYGLE
ncbi:MAG: ABC transporter substrate-binding protein [Dehalococcoidia bacterium]